MTFIVRGERNEFGLFADLLSDTLFSAIASFPRVKSRIDSISFCQEDCGFIGFEKISRRFEW